MSQKKLIFSPVASGLRLSFERVCIAWRTLGVGVLSLTLLAASGALWASAEYHWLVIILNTAALYMLYIVMHDAAHHAVFIKKSWNTVLGHFCIALFHPGFAFKTFRFIHMQHHRFTNENEKDPDLWAYSRYKWLLPLKWLTTDLGYMQFCWQNRRAFKSKEKWWQGIQLLLFLALLIILISQGYGWEVLLFWAIPFRIALFFLTLFLDYLPHIPYGHRQATEPFKATKVYERRGWFDQFLFVLMLGQNYHLVHHLFPQVPFYQSRKVWRLIKYRVMVLNK